MIAAFLSRRQRLAAAPAPAPAPFIVAPDQLNPRGMRAYERWKVMKAAAVLAAGGPTEMTPHDKLFADIRARRATKGV